MAWLEQKKSGQFLVAFRFGEQKFKRSLKTSQPKEARAAITRIEENSRLVERGLLTLPEDADVVAFLLSDGRVPARIVVEADNAFFSLCAVSGGDPQELDRIELVGDDRSASSPC